MWAHVLPPLRGKAPHMCIMPGARHWFGPCHSMTQAKNIFRHDDAETSRGEPRLSCYRMVKASHFNGCSLLAPLRTCEHPFSFPSMKPSACPDPEPSTSSSPITLNSSSTMRNRGPSSQAKSSAKFAHKLHKSDATAAARDKDFRALFNATRFEHPIRWPTFLLLILYFPFGILLFCFRVFFMLFIGLPLFPIFSWLGAHRIYFRFGLPIVGVRAVLRSITGRKLDYAKANPKIVVCNHVTDFDGAAFYTFVPPSRLVGITTSYLRQMVEFVNKVGMGCNVIYREPSQDAVLKAKVRDEVTEVLTNSNRTLFVHAEGGTTSGKKGLMRYNKFVFGLDGFEITPIALKVRSFFQINTDCITGKTFFPNLFWLFFCPWTTFEYNVFDNVSRCEGEAPIDYARRLQEQTADYLGIEATDYFYRMKNQMEHVVR
eukprot:gnl/Trimastix_PCT/2378.p1 GENE.gnl/Trimastix_PCT/2378~~gnl/Trimastix_PCT/2378.p1  ORF type:complete len:430 (+),score=79.46 gnl/Trimastix_PCT/2378:1001-2290(+)